MARAFSKPFYNSKEWDKARENVLKRDNYLCVMCLEEGKVVPADVVHHKIHLTEKNINDPNISLNEKNLISLCKDHHKEVHKGEHAKGRIVKEQYPYEFDSNGMLIEKAHVVKQ